MQGLGLAARPLAPERFRDNLLLFVAELQSLGVSQGAVVSYVAGVRHFVQTVIAAEDQKLLRAALQGCLRLSKQP